MDFHELPLFLGFAVGGFLLMAAVGIRAAVALFSSIPLTRRRKEVCPGFNARAAFVRIAQVSSLSILLCAGVTALVIRFGSTAVITGYGLGFVLAFALNLKRMSPTDAQNQKNYEKFYADCYPSSDSKPDGGAAFVREGANSEKAAGGGGADLK